MHFALEHLEHQTYFLHLDLLTRDTVRNITHLTLSRVRIMITTTTRTTVRLALIGVSPAGEVQRRRDGNEFLVLTLLTEHRITELTSHSVSLNTCGLAT